MASAFDGFSLLKLFQHDTLDPFIKYIFLLHLNPILLELIRQSSQHQFLSQYLTILDEFLIAALDTYPLESLALQLSTLMHENTFPSPATGLDFCLLPLHAEDNILCIVPQHVYQIIETGILDAEDLHEAHRATLREFFLNPVRSKHHSFQSSAGKIYVESLLACFNYLDTQLFRYDYCPHCFLDGFQLISFNTEETEEDLNTVFHNQGTGDTIRNKSEGHHTVNEDWNENVSYNPEDTDIVNTEQDIQAWYANWHQVVVSKENTKGSSKK